MENLTALIIYLFCIMSGGSCVYEEEAHVTTYAPEFGDALNCMEPCDITASGLEVDYGRTIACGPSIPFGTKVYIDGWGWRTCDDRGGAINDDEIDIAVRAVDFNYWSGNVGVVWIMEPVKNDK